MRQIKTIEYGEVLNSTILKVFGDEMTYNELKKYAKNENETTYLKVYFNTGCDDILITIWFDNQIVMDKNVDINYRCDMFYYLAELEAEMLEKDEDEDEDDDYELTEDIDAEKIIDFWRQQDDKLNKLKTHD